MRFLIIVILLLSVICVKSVDWCFKCSNINHGENYPKLQNCPCDSSKTELDLHSKYTSCLIAHDGNKVRYQAIVTTDFCDNKSKSKAKALYMDKMREKLGPDAVITCCHENGCNWNSTTALFNKTISADHAQISDQCQCQKSGDYTFLIIYLTLQALVALPLVYCACTGKCTSTANGGSGNETSGAGFYGGGGGGFGGDGGGCGGDGGD